MEEKVSLLTKRKSIQLVFDYCMDNKIEFTVSPREMIVDEFEIALKISGIKPAVALGMFAKEHKFEVFGMKDVVKQKAPVNGIKRAEEKGNGTLPETQEVKKEQAGTVLNF